MLGRCDVLLIDSGVGGLTIAGKIKRQLPKVSLAHFADIEHLPYGEKSEAWLEQRLVEILSQLTPSLQPIIVVIACNTASTTVLPSLRQRFNQLSIVGVVPAIKPASAMTQTGVIGLLGTPGTIERNYTAQLITDFAASCQIIRVGSSRLVEIAEQKLSRQAIEQREICQICQPFMESEVDVVVLGCTHFPFLKAEIAACLRGCVSLIDSGDAIAERVSSLLQGQQLAGANRSLFICKQPSKLTSLTDIKAMGFTIAERSI